jgi:hypothetical protein
VASGSPMARNRDRGGPFRDLVPFGPAGTAKSGSKSQDVGGDLRFCAVRPPRRPQNAPSQTRGAPKTRRPQRDAARVTPSRRCCSSGRGESGPRAEARGSRASR